jgi:hypothetical protein
LLDSPTLWANVEVYHDWFLSKFGYPPKQQTGGRVTTANLEWYASVHFGVDFAIRALQWDMLAHSWLGFLQVRPEMFV